MAQLTVFGKEIKKRLVDLDQSQEWLIRKIREKTGMFFDSSYLYKIMIGERKAPSIVAAINEILDLPEQAS